MSLITAKKRIKARIDNSFIEENTPMSQYTSFKAGGAAALLVTPQSIDELKTSLRILTEESCSFMILGNGSNILVKDEGYQGVIVRIGDAFEYIKRGGKGLVCGAGALLSVVARTAAAEGLAGSEFASGIPGSIGGAVFMNAGAYDGEIAKILEKVHLISRDGSREFDMPVEELDMSYRHTLLHETGDVVTEVTLRLEEGVPAEIKGRIADFTSRRNAKQPVTFASAGSFFKRPEGYFAGKLVQDAGLKGLCIGGAQVSELHSGFIINRGNATATDILQLMEVVQARVFDEFGVMLEPEVRIIG